MPSHCTLTLYLKVVIIKTILMEDVRSRVIPCCTYSIGWLSCSPKAKGTECMPDASRLFYTVSLTTLCGLIGSWITEIEARKSSMPWDIMLIIHLTNVYAIPFRNTYTSRGTGTQWTEYAAKEGDSTLAAESEISFLKYARFCPRFRWVHNTRLL